MYTPKTRHLLTNTNTQLLAAERFFLVSFWRTFLVSFIRSCWLFSFYYLAFDLFNERCIAHDFYSLQVKITEKKDSKINLTLCKRIKSKKKDVNRANASEVAYELLLYMIKLSARKWRRKQKLFLWFRTIA